MRKSTAERLLPCIVDGNKIPRDLIEVSVNRASNRYGTNAEEWETTLESGVCALYRKIF